MANEKTLVRPSIQPSNLAMFAGDYPSWPWNWHRRVTKLERVDYTSKAMPVYMYIYILVGGFWTPVKKYEFVSWNYDIPNWMEKIIQIFQTTNQIYTYIYISTVNICKLHPHESPMKNPSIIIHDPIVKIDVSGAATPPAPEWVSSRIEGKDNACRFRDVTLKLLRFFDVLIDVIWLKECHIFILSSCFEPPWGPF